MMTTINIRKDILTRITCAAKKLDISQSKLIVSLLKEVLDDTGTSNNFGSLVKYQKRENPGGWHTFHISFREDDYEYFLDFRKLLKMSVSLILAYAVNKYLNDMSKEKVMDKNLIRNYVIVKEYIKDIICWKFIWGYSPDIIKELR